jgi:SAM-dependent methyltransferase
MSDTTETFRMSVGAAEVYESKFVPALFGEWAPRLVEAAGVKPGQAVLDVACGTGVVARAAAGRTGGHGRVVGVDLNEAMLVVAQRLRPDIEWRQGDAQAPPFPDASFDVVVCQSGLMFVSDVVGALPALGPDRVGGAPGRDDPHAGGHGAARFPGRVRDGRGGGHAAAGADRRRGLRQDPRGRSPCSRRVRRRGRARRRPHRRPPGYGPAPGSSSSARATMTSVIKLVA